jgi:2-methylcitrate dehydratase PrpD
VSGANFIAALVLGYEVTCRIGEAQTNAVETERGIHNPAANGPFGAAAAAARLLGLDAATVSSALGIAGSHCGGLVEYAWDGTMTKRLHLGRAAQLGLESALLARGGFTGPATIIEGRYGYLRAYSPAPRAALLTEGLGQSWLMESLVIKAYPCHLSCQAIVAAIQQLKRQRRVDPDAVGAMHIRAGAQLLQERFLNPEPTNMLGAQYSIPYTSAVAVYRDLDDPLTYDESVLEHPGIRRLARAITWEEARIEPPSERGAELVIVVDGTRLTLTAQRFPGSPADPLTFPDAVDKFRRYTRRFLDDARQDAIIACVQDLPAVADMRTLTALVGG